MSAAVSEAIEPEQRSMRLIRLNDFEAPFPLVGEEGDLYRRRFSTLFVDESRSRRGGLGRVTYAMNARGEQLALKTLILPEGDDERDDQAEVLLGAFRREYECQRALANLRGFPRLYGFARADGAPAIVMEWIEGPTLREALPHLPARTYVDASGALRRSVLPEIAVSLGVAMLDILLGAGELDCTFLHRDLSPGNILFDRVGDTWHFSLVDTNRMHFGPVGVLQGCANFARLWGPKRFFEILAQEYAAARKADPVLCRAAILTARERYWRRYIRHHHVDYDLEF